MIATQSKFESSNASMNTHYLIYFHCIYKNVQKYQLSVYSNGVDKDVHLTFFYNIDNTIKVRLVIYFEFDGICKIISLTIEWDSPLMMAGYKQYQCVSVF